MIYITEEIKYKRDFEGGLLIKYIPFSKGGR